jgi:ubiquinone/menaquinone biosynthesis C-methylase UbiE
MFDKSARFYDAIYSWKDYAGESEKLHALVQEKIPRPALTLLDVACGTGAHLAHLRQHYHVEGLDLDPGLLEVAHERLPGVPLHAGDMLDFDLGRTFDVVTCLFGAVAYVRTLDNLKTAVRNMARHLAPGGLLFIEPFFSPSVFVDDRKPHALFVNEPDLKVARISVNEVRGTLAILNFQYLVGVTGEVSYFNERHEMALFTEQEHMDAFAAAGMTATHDPEGLMRRGLYIGVKPPS